MKSILLTSIGSATSLNIYKLLKDVYRVVATDTNPYGYTPGSMMVDTFYQISSAHSDRYVTELQNIVRKENIDIIIPVHDEEIRVLTQHRDVFPIPILMSNTDTVQLFGEKLKSAEFIKSLGLDVPAILCSNHDSQPCIMRKKQGVGSNGIELFKTGISPDGLLKSDYSCEDYFVQELIEGEEYTVDVASDRNGRPFLIIPRQRVEVKAGVATKVRIVYDEQLIEIVKKIYANCCIPGFSNVQFMKRGNHYYFIELNYRYGGMSIASALASYNYPADLVSYYMNGTELPEGINQFPIKWGAIVTRYYEEQIYEA